jgi:hypothetical protein
MKQKTRNSIPGKTPLTSLLDKRLLAYSAAATAAGVGLVASTQSAEAKIVYTAANVTIQENGATVNIDVNNDGVADFGIYFGGYPGVRRQPEGFHQYALGMFPMGAAGNEIWAFSSKGVECAAALPPAVKVGPGAPFQAKSLIMWESEGSYSGGGFAACPWESKHRGAFLGLKFVVNGQTHYGWAHVTVGPTGTVLNGYAYETVPNQPIFTGKTSGPASIAGLGPAPLPVPQPATLGLLAHGSRGLSIWRRPEDCV